MKTKKLLLTALLCAFLCFSAMGIGCFGGSLELTDFIVEATSVVTTYEVEDDVSLNGLKMTAIYNDDTRENVELKDVKIFLGEEDITNNLSKITETVGTKKVKIVYATEYGEKTYELTITVNEEAVVLPSLNKFGAPAFIANFQSSIEDATDDDTSTKFESEYFVAEKTTYVVGADNAFKFIPEALDEDYQVVANVIVDTTIKVDGEEDALEKTLVENSDYVYEYKYNGVLMVTENAAKNEFDFADSAIGKVFKISVLPDATVYEIENVNAIEFEMEIVSGYNVYDAGELCLMDNTGRGEWAGIRAQYGLTDVQTNGIVLHNSLQVTKEHIPAAFQYTLPDTYNIEYKLTTKDKETGADVVKTGSPEDFGLDRTFLWNTYEAKAGNYGLGNTPNLYTRLVSDSQSFNFYGNYYDLDLTKLPLVASFEANVAPGSYANSASTYYGTDFSNTTFLNVIGKSATTGDADELCNFENVALHGNAGTDNLLVTANTTGYKNETLVYCGGIIFIKVGHIDAQVENLRAYEFFITFFGEENNVMSFNKTKVYDSASNAMFIWQKTETTITQSYWQRSGGPLILVQHDEWDTLGAETMATIDIDENCVLQSYVSGSEAWFQSVGATGIVAQFKEMDAILNLMQKAMFNTDKKMNLITLVMASGGIEAMTATGVQGKVTYGDALLDRVIPTSATPSVGGIVHTILSKVKDGEYPPIFNFGNSVYYYGGDPQEGGYGILDAMIETPSVNNGFMAMKTAAATADKFVLNYAGFGLLLGLFDYITQS